MMAFQVTFKFSGGLVQTDIALSSENAKSALEYAKYRAKEIESIVEVSVKRISKQAAEDIVDNNGVDWYTS